MDLDYYTHGIGVLKAAGVWTQEIYDYVHDVRTGGSDKDYIAMIEKGRAKRGQN